MPFDTITVPTFGGGLNFSGDPTTIDPSQWSWCDGFLPREGTAEVVGTLTQIHSGTWLPAGSTPIGMVPDYVTNGTTANTQRVLIISADNGTSVIRLFRMQADGTTIEIAVLGAAPTALVNFAGFAVTTAFINGSQLLSAGPSTATNYSLVRYDGTNFFVVQPAMALNPTFLTSVQGRLVTARFTGDLRQVAWSDQGSYSVWDPAISNSADNATLADVGTISGLASWLDGAVMASTRRMYQLSSTGGIPAFTIQAIQERGPLQPAANHMVATPTGVFFDGSDDFYFLGSGGLGRAMHLRWNSFSFGLPSFWWHPALNSVVVAAFTPASPMEVLGYDPTRNAWWRRSHPTTTGTPGLHTVTPTVGAGGGAVIPGRYWTMGSNGQTFIDVAGTAQAGAIVDTKDFAFGSPVTESAVDRIKVDWESLTNANTDAIDVLAYSRNDLSPGILGNSGLSMDLTAQFVFQGTLTAAQHELTVRLRGKYHRLRFRQNSGRARIRGFAVHAMPLGERPN